MSDLIDVMVVLTARNDSAMPELRALLQSHSRLSQGEPGCLRFESYESTSIPNTFVLIERWESQAALGVHRTAEGFTTIYAPKVLPLVDRVAYVCRPLE